MAVWEAACRISWAGWDTGSGSIPRGRTATSLAGIQCASHRTGRRHLKDRHKEKKLISSRIHSYECKYMVDTQGGSSPGAGREFPTLESACHVKPITEHEPLPRPQRLSSIALRLSTLNSTRQGNKTQRQWIDDETGRLRHVYLIYVQLKSVGLLTSEQQASTTLGLIKFGKIKPQDNALSPRKLYDTNGFSILSAASRGI